MRWAAALLFLTGLGGTAAQAGGFGFTVTNATVNNLDSSGNPNTRTFAVVGDKLTIVGAPFSSYQSTSGAPAIADNDLNRYTADVAATATAVTGNVVRYQGTFTITYTGPAFPAGNVVETGSVDLTATYNGSGNGIVRGLFLATPGAGAAPFDKDFALYNPGRFFGVYTPNGGNPALGSITANLNAGDEGFLASINESTLVNNDANSNGRADVGETFTLTTPLSGYYPTAAGSLMTLADSDLSRYTLTLNGTAASVVGTTVQYNGTFSIKYTGPAYPAGAEVETGAFNLTAEFNEALTRAAKLSGTFVAAPGVPAALAGDPNFSNSDFAIFNPADFHGTYVPSGGGANGIVSGTMTGGVVGFSASLANGTVTNNDANSNGHADVGETFTATLPLAAYLAVGAPELLDKDLSRYSVTLNGTATAVAGTTVTYTGPFRITYSGPAITTDIEAGTFTITADYSAGDGSAHLSGALTADAGAQTPTPPFDVTDYAAFNPAVLNGHYTPIGAGATGSLRASLVGGSNVEQIQTRKVGAGIEGSPTAATDTNDNRRAIVASGARLYVLDPATGDDAPGWAGGKALDGRVIGRAAVLRDDVFVGTDAGTLYRFNLITGAQTGSGQPGGAGSKILTAPAPADTNNDGVADEVYISVSNLNGTAATAIVKVAPAALGTPTAGPTLLSANAISVSSPAVPGTGKVFVGTQAGLFVLDTSLTPQNSTATPTPTSPFVAGPNVYVGTGNGSTFQTINASTGVLGPTFPLGSPLQLSAFYEKRSNLLQAGVSDGRIYSFNLDGTFAGLTLPGLFNQANTGGSFSMPVQSNNILYRATQNKQIISGIALNGDSQQTIDLISAVGGAVSATGQTVGADYILGASADGYIHMIGVR
jgi:hypothetical protein